MTHVYVTAFVISFVMFAQPAITHALTMCSSPLRPMCIDMDYTYEDDLGVMRCKQDLHRLVNEAKEYTRCLKKQISETRQEIDDARKKFEERSKEVESNHQTAQ